MSSICYCFLFCFTIFLYLNNNYTVFSHIPNNNIVIQEIIDQNDKIKVQFGYASEQININTLTNLKFSILNSTTEEHIKNFLARIVVTDGVEVFNYNNIFVKDGDFSINHTFTHYGNHQVLSRVDTNSSIISASFDVTILPSLESSSSPFLANSVKSNLDNDQSSEFTTYLIIGAGLAVSIGIAIILLSVLKKK